VTKIIKTTTKEAK